MTSIAQKPATESLTFRNAVADFRTASTDAIESFLESVSHVLADPESDPVERYLAEQRTIAAEREIQHRQSISRYRSGTTTKHDKSRAEWTELARLVRERVEVPDILRLAGLDLKPSGQSRGRDEFSSPCPICNAGDDRLRCWSGPSGRLWCRRCEWSGDVISAASLIVKTGAFRDCVKFLAGLGGVEGGSL